MSLKRNIKIAPHVADIVEQLRNAGFETLLVGGAVRDLLFGRVPKDYDLSTAATPERTRDVFGRRRARIIGKRFRLVHLYHGNEIIEISTFRKAPQKTRDGEMLPVDNDFGTSVEDAWRRDFTVNAIFYDPGTGEIIDHTGKGIEDLKAKKVRAVGNPLERFNEDPVRILRALKLVGQYGFSLEPETGSALSTSLPLITRCSHSRLALEFEKIIKSPYSDKILPAFRDYGFLAYYLPFMNERWAAPEREYMLELLAERNSRLLAGKYRDSISLAIATAALPFVAGRLSENIENIRLSMWNYRFGIEKEIRRVINEVLSPYSFPKRIIASSVGMLLMQPSMLAMKRREKILQSKRYRHARELMTLQNNVAPRNIELEEFWPQHGTRGGAFRKDGANKSGHHGSLRKTKLGN
ncbi:MAG: hypothetical protein GXP32_07930 [Kiritimatiellaeota bacterium]|nr:hypothetical protein [Kiritimatiellota bacterium]